MMDNIEDIIKDIIKKMAKEAIKKHGYFHNEHEFESVLREEIDEAVEEIESIINEHNSLWTNIKENFNINEDIDNIYETTNKAILELFQILAVIIKYKNGDDTESF